MGGWSDKTKLILISTLVEVVAEVEVELGNIFKRVSQKNRNFWLKIGYNSGCNIKYTWLLKVEYLLNGSTDLYEILNLSS